MLSDNGGLWRMFKWKNFYTYRRAIRWQTSQKLFTISKITQIEYLSVGGENIKSLGIKSIFELKKLLT